MRLTCLFALCGAALAAQPASAGLLPDDGSIVDLPGTPSPAGSVVATQTTPFAYERLVTVFANPPQPPTPVTGTVQSQVVRGADGSFDFQWKVNLSEGTLSSFRLSDFPAAKWFADWRRDPGNGVAPTFGRRVFPNGGEFSFTTVVPGVGEFGGLRAGQSSYFFFLDTDAPSFDQSGHYVLDSSLSNVGSGSVSGVSQPYSTFAPSMSPSPPPPIPEPQTWALMLTGLAGLAFFGRRIRRG